MFYQTVYAVPKSVLWPCYGPEQRRIMDSVPCRGWNICSLPSKQ